MSNVLCVAVDGPAAAGKTTLGRLLAQRLGACFVDTGNMYRALTWLALKKRMDLDNHGALTKLAQETNIDLTYGYGGDITTESVYVDGQDVTREMRNPDVERWISLVSSIKDVRKVLVAKQQELSKKGPIVMTGRDVGTVVMPHAKLKLFLIASPEERARRRHREMEEMGREVDYHTILDDLRRRDKIDSERDASPLTPAPDAVIVDTDGCTVAQVLAKIEARVKALL